jgi:predicted RNA-binding Zn-ribbon protein involved in translation (DUF1610 family)
MTGYDYLKSARNKCVDLEGEKEQNRRSDLYMEFSSKGWDTCHHKLICVKCGNVFYGKNPTGKYCGYRCRNDAQIEARRQRHISKRKKHCTSCNEFFEAKRDDTVFCSPACKQRWYRQRKDTKKVSVTDLGYEQLSKTEKRNNVMIIGLADISTTEKGNIVTQLSGKV